MDMHARRVSFATRLENWLPKIVVAPTFVAMMVFIYGFIIWTAIISLTKSRLLPSYDFAGFSQYIKLFQNDRWLTACENLFIFSILFIGICIGIGLLLAILLDQKIRGDGFLRTIYLYPMSLSFIVTGTAWKWIMNPGLGIEKLFRDFGFSSFQFDWLVNPEMSIYTIIIAAIWQSSGFVMAMFLAGLRGIDDAIIKAARIDGASQWRIYSKIIIPNLRPIFFSAFIVLTHISIKSFDLVMVLTNGGPGYSSELPARFMYVYSFDRGRLGYGAASAMIMFCGVAAIIIPYLYSELRRKDGDA